MGIAAFAALFFAAWVDEAHAVPGSIAGTVTSVATGAPIEGVEVCSSPVEWTQEPGQEGNVFGCAETGEDGTYLITNVMSSIEYRVQFKPDEDEYVWEWYDDGANWEAAEKVAVESGPVTGIDAQLDSPARVEGTVVAAADGLPVEGVEACAYRITDAYAACDWTASDGSFAIRVWYPGEFEIEFAPGHSGRELALQFYDGKDDWEDGEIFQIELSETITGIDAELRPGGRISGRIVRAAANETKVARVCSIEAFTGRLWTCTWSEEGTGAYSLPYLAQGVYKVVFSPDLTEWFPEAEKVMWAVPTQFWDNQATLAAATPISIGSTGGHLTGVDAFYGPRPPKAALPSVPAPLVKPPANKAARKCPRGKKPKLVKGKRRCVRARKHKRGQRKHQSNRTTWQRLLRHQEPPPGTWLTGPAPLTRYDGRVGTRKP